MTLFFVLFIISLFFTSLLKNTIIYSYIIWIFIAIRTVQLFRRNRNVKWNSRVTFWYCDNTNWRVEYQTESSNNVKLSWLIYHDLKIKQKTRIFQLNGVTLSEFFFKRISLLICLEIQWPPSSPRLHLSRHLQRAK